MARACTFLTGEGLSKKLMSAGCMARMPREVFNLKYVDFVALSPDRKFVAFTELFNAYVAPLPPPAAASNSARTPAPSRSRKVSGDAGSYLHWSAAPTRSLHWMVGDHYVSRALKDVFAFLPGAPKELPKASEAKALQYGPEQPVYTPSSVSPCRRPRHHHARCREGAGSDRGRRGDRRWRPHPRRRARAMRGDPAGARVIDASGKTLMPGIVDAHAHAAHFGQGVVPQQNWAYYANLAFGVTAMHDPSATNEFVFSQAELVKAGAMVGPRVFSTGTILYGADGDFKAVVNSLDDARFAPQAHAGAGRLQRQELQPAAPRPAPADQHRRARAGHAGGGGGRLTSTTT
jgi:hypothetical protein